MQKEEPKNRQVSMAHKKKAHKKEKSKEMHKGPEAHKQPMASKDMMHKGHSRGK